MRAVQRNDRAKTRKPKVAIIGAGVAGLAAAWRLRDARCDVVVFEKSRGVSGRAASRTRHGARIDIGANYFKLDDAQLERLVLHEISREGLVRIEGDIWTFDGAGRITPGDPIQNRQGKWNYSSGISTLGKHLAAAAAADVRLGQRIGGLRYRHGSWYLEHLGGVCQDDSEFFDAVLLTAPAPQALDIVRASEPRDVDLSHVRDALARVEYHLQWCFALGFRQPLETRPPYFALINSDRSHAIAWLSFENHKPARDLGGHQVVMVQMSPEWSTRHRDVPAEELLPDVNRTALGLLGLPERPADWFDSQRWRFAHPFTAADGQNLSTCESAGLFFAGDALVGRGRVSEALATGLRSAELIMTKFGL